MPYEINTEEEFSSLINTESFVLIHFWAEWNSSDYLMKKILAELEVEFKNEITVASVDVDIEILFDFFRRLRIINVPTLIYFKDGKQVSIDVAPKLNLKDERERIKQKLQKLLISSFDE